MRTPRLKRLAVAVLLIGAIGTIIALVPWRASGFMVHAATPRSCGAMGTYGYTGFGTIFEGNALGFTPGISSTNGTITLDGNGNWFVHEVEVVNGVVHH